jgi:hypothetical protein
MLKGVTFKKRVMEGLVTLKTVEPAVFPKEICKRIVQHHIKSIKQPSFTNPFGKEPKFL